MYVAIPKNCYTHVLFVGAGVFLMSSTLSGSGWTPFASYTMPKMWILSCPMAHLSLLNTSPLSTATFIKLCRFLSCAVFVFPYTAMSSAIPRVPGHFSRIWSIRYRKTSWDITRPKGWTQNLSNAEKKVVSSCDFRLASRTSIRSSQQAWRSAGIPRTGVWSPRGWECDDDIS